MLELSNFKKKKCYQIRYIETITLSAIITPLKRNITPEINVQ